MAAADPLSTAAPGWRDHALQPGWCRDCVTPLSSDAGERCTACGSRRTIRHAEINALAIAHLDCDAFYATIEKRDDPSLADQPVIVGGGVRGVVSTCCYIARAYGVRSAMPMFKARQLCPEAVVVPPNMAKYAAESRRVRALLDEITPLIQPLSIDEAFLDLSGTERLHHAPPAATLLKLQSRIAQEIGITVSIGLAPNKFLAKIASDLDKPNGFSVVGAAEALDFLADKPVSVIFGVGPEFAKTLARDGFHRIRDLRRAEERELAARYGEMGLRLHRLAWAKDARSVNASEERKSISAETTFDADLSRLADLEAALWRLAVKVTDRAKASALAGGVVTLKLKTADHRIRTRRRTLPDPTQLADVVFAQSRALLADEADGARFRLIGVGLSDLSAAGPDAGDLLDPQKLRRAAVERAVDKARARFGEDAVSKGRGRRDAAPEDGSAA
jgi:DNA polymerase-4